MLRERHKRLKYTTVWRPSFFIKSWSKSRYLKASAVQFLGTSGEEVVHTRDPIALEPRSRLALSGAPQRICTLYFSQKTYYQLFKKVIIGRQPNINLTSGRANRGGSPAVLPRSENFRVRSRFLFL